MNKKKHFALIALAAGMAANATPVTSPDGKTAIDISCNGGTPAYTVTYNGATVIETSPLGLNTNVGDFTKNLAITKTSPVKKETISYSLPNIKQSKVEKEVCSQTFTLSQNDKPKLDLMVSVSNNNVAIAYKLLEDKETMCCVINSEATSFNMPEGTTTFLCPQMREMTGFARTAPSYETHYEADAPTGKNGWGLGYTFPCLFKVPAKAGDKAGQYWALISETGTDGNYCACRLDNKGGNSYAIAFPSMKENNGYGTNNVQAALPSMTPWRTITVGETLEPVVTTTVTWDLVNCKTTPATEQQARDEAAKKYGRGSWSWIIADDASCNYDTQKKYIDFSAAMGWESLLIDAQWDRQIGRDRIAELARYARTKGVNLYLWYNSNGKWNDAPQTPRNCMDTEKARRAEMAWLKSIGIRGIKVDFFGGDKQCTMQLYEDIMRDAQEFGLLVIFHGCTLPRGWERMYPNYVASEAVRASENLHFSQGECDREAMDATFLPFLRNAVGSMDFGGSTLNWYYNAENSGKKWGGHRITSDVFALSTAILFQSAVQHFAMAPNNLTDAPAWAVDFMKKVPTTWDELRFIDGYPGKYVILARRTGDKWYVTGVNAEKAPLKKTLDISMFPAGTVVNYYSDDARLKGSLKQVKVSKKQTMDITIPCNGGIVINN